MKKILLITFIAMCAGFAFTAFAIESNKPDTHTASWGVLHGKQAKVNDKQCVICHTDRLECITCHEDVKPRSHTATWKVKGHTQEARWNKKSCQTCHQENFCMECHDTAIPMSHKAPGFGPPLANHCNTSCYIAPNAKWTSSISKDCLVCHRTRPVLKSTGQWHNQ